MKKIIILIIAAIGFLSAIASEKNSILNGQWECAQEESLSDLESGNNSFVLNYSPDGKSVVQKGKAVIDNETEGKSSILKYKLTFDSTIKNTQFTNILKKVDLLLIQDELDVFGGDLTDFFPKVGEEVNGTMTFTESGHIRNIYSDGSVVECIKL